LLARRNLGGRLSFVAQAKGDEVMGRSILLILLGVPLPLVILLALFWR
jgi:hypothetical protein